MASRGRRFYPIAVEAEYDPGIPTTLIDPSSLIEDRYQSMPRTGNPHGEVKDLPKVHGTNSWSLPWDSLKERDRA